MIHTATIITILLMMLMTYFTRIIGFLALYNRPLSPRMKAVMQAAPGCVLITLIAPYFATDQPADLLALAITILAATRFSFFTTIVISICSAGLFRHLL